ncbi:MAG: MFS transporter [Pirellulales bacterium]
MSTTHEHSTSAEDRIPQVSPTHASHEHSAGADRVPWNQLIAYGLGGLIPIALFNIAGQLMGLLGNISLGLSAFWLGTIMIVPRLWDACSDPIIGHLTDNTRTRWGRRRPFILLGGIAVAVSFVAMWWVPRGDWIREILPNDAAFNWFQLVFILLGLLVFFTACNLFEIPHGALGMEMSDDYHERTRLFSAKSFLGNLFAMGTPWLLFLAALEIFSGKGGNIADGMRYLSLFIAAILIPLSVWWFFALREPRLYATEVRKKPDFWRDMEATVTNKTFVRLTFIVFTLAMGFNFVNLFSYYITIFYLYGGDADAASKLLGIGGTTWAVTGLVAVFPLNVISRRVGKSRTLLIAIVLMCIAQLSKIVCYNPSAPYLVLIPTVLLSTGMLMFFTLGSSMVGDVCDEDELRTGTRSEGSYFSVYWWFIKLGTAFASFVTGILLVYTNFDEAQSVGVDALKANVAVIRTEANAWLEQQIDQEFDTSKLDAEIAELLLNADKLDKHFLNSAAAKHDYIHMQQLASKLNQLRAEGSALQQARKDAAEASAEFVSRADALPDRLLQLRKQSPTTLFRLRLIEIGLPLMLSVVSILLTLRYPLTEQRCYEIKELLKRRREELAAAT